MKLNRPKNSTWTIAIILGILGILAHIVTIPVISPIAFWFVVAAFVLLAMGTYFKGL